MNTLDEMISGEEATVDLNSIVSTEAVQNVLPKAAVRNRAATTALLANDPSKAVDNYQLMMAEGERGEDAVVKQLQSQISNESNEQDTKSFMSILSDPAIPYERKSALIKSLKENQIRQDSGIKLMTNALEQESTGESKEAEDARVGSVSRSIKEIYDQRAQVQGLVNAHVAGLDGVSGKTLLEAIGVGILPTGEGQAVAGLQRELDPGTSIWKTLKSLALPGSTTQSIRERLELVPPEDRPAMAKRILDAMGKNGNLLLPSDNHFSQAQKAQQIFEEGGYSNTEKWIDNVAGLLDVVGLGWAVRSSKLIKATKPLPAEVKAAGEASKPSVAGVAQPTSPRERMPLTVATGKPTAGAYDDKIAKLEDEKASLLGDAGNTLDKGEVAKLKAERAALVQKQSLFSNQNKIAQDIQSEQKITSKEAKKQASIFIKDNMSEIDGQLKRIDAMLESNKASSTVMQKVADLEKKIETLKANNTEILLKKTPIADLISRMEANSVVRQANPVSPHETIKSANPQKARDFHETIVKGDDTVAEGLTGVSREQAIINDVYPQAVTSSGKVVAQPTDIQRNLRRELQVPDSVREAIHAGGHIEYTLLEKAAILANVKRDFQSAEGLVMHENMGGFSSVGGQVKISAVYGTPEGAFKSAQEASDQAKYALQKYGVDDKDIEILSREGLDYVPVKLSDVKDIEGSYMVRVNSTHEIDPTDVVKFEEFGVKLNFLDRLPSTQWGDHGSASRYLVDASSMLHPTYTGAATAAVDQSARFEKLLMDEAAKYSNQFKNLPKDAKNRVDTYIREANYNGIAYDPVDLASRGMSPAEISAVKSWRDYWDGNFYLENLDVVRTMNAQGYQMFRNKTADLYAKPVAKNQNIQWLYDPSVDDVVRWGKGEGDVLYAAGGTYAKLRRPVTINGVEVEHMIVRNTPTEFLRKFRESDQVLNYREGYYQLQYKAPRFVDEITIGANGQEIRRAVAVAGDTVEAQRFATRMQASANPDTTYTVRADDRALQRGTDDWFDVNSAGGRIAQRHRGKLLEDGAGLNHLGDGSYILDPVSSAVRAAKSISGRTVTRPMLESAKARFMQQYAKHLPSDGMGGVRFPTKANEIGGKGLVSTSEVADAKTTWGYIKYLENGYINGIDKMYKQFLHAAADMSGRAGLSKTERALLLSSEKGPAEFAKGTVFMALLGMHPLRQIVVQFHQAARTWGYNPIGWINGGIMEYSTSYIHSIVHSKFGTNTAQFSAKNQDFIDFVNTSGMLHAVDKQNLVRGFLSDAADNTNRIVKYGAKAVQLPRKIGFDTGEMGNTLVHLAAVYERYKRLGKDMTNPHIRDQAASEARAISYDMNFAGDMPYNQTAPSLLLQFAQVPHKALLQLSNRRIPLDVRMRLLGTDMLFWGPPTAAVSAVMGGDILPDNPKLKEFFTDGAESFLLNEMFRTMTEQPDMKIDFSSLVPADMTGWGEFFHAMYSGGAEKLLSNSPAGQLFSPQGRIGNAVKSTLRFFSVIEPIEEKPDTFLQVTQEVLSIASGFSAGMRAYVALETGRRYDKLGNLIDRDTHPVEAIFEGLGFGDGNRRNMFLVNKKASEFSKEYKDDVLKDLKAIREYVTKTLKTDNPDVEMIQRVSSRVLSRYKDSPEALKIIQNQLSMDLQDPQSKLLYVMMKAGGIPEASKMKDVFRQAPIPEDQKVKLLQRVDDLEAIRKEKSK